MTSVHRIEIAARDAAHDSEGKAVAEELRHFGLDAESVRAVHVYTFAGMADDEAERVAREFLADAVVDEFAVNKPVLKESKKTLSVEIVRRQGVMHPAEASVRKTLSRMGLNATRIQLATRFLVAGKIDKAQLKLAAGKLLANDVIEEYVIGGQAPFDPDPKKRTASFKRTEIPLLTMDDKAMADFSIKQQLYLSLPEMKACQDYFRTLARNPTDIELESIAQTWSEHCVHKTFRGIIRYKGPEGEERIDNLLKSTVAQVTNELDKPWCLSVFKDNAGVIAFDKQWGAVFKVETHNHPSAIEPYGGAGTGIGGVIRDPLGTGLGAKPIMNTDVFCFGNPEMPTADVPKGALHPRRVMRGVVAGVRDYGNRMGIPTANGAIYFDDRYVGNPLVFAGNVGLIPRTMVEKEAFEGQMVVVVGGRTGRDGIHGATFSSVELHEESEMVSSGAVQIGNPIEEKKVRDFLLRARDAALYTFVTDCGAGGLSSAVGEMGEKLGVEVNLDTVPLKYEGLSYTEIWISEAQERMVFAVHSEKLPALRELAAEEDVEMTVIGHFTGDAKLHLKYHGEEVGCLDMSLLHDGVPRIEREAVWVEPKRAEPVIPEKKDYTDDLKRILGSYNVCSKEWVIRQYDHEVQGGSVVKPLVGVANEGPGDAAVIAPILGNTRGLVISNGMNPKFSDIDPYHMAAGAIDEALRNIIAVGGSIEHCAILDNFCWGNCDKPDRLGGLVRAAKACYDIARAYGVPFISGKDSLNNEFGTEKGTIVIPGTLLISAMAVMEDVRLAVTMDAKRAGDGVYLIGGTHDELGGSHFYALHNEIGRNVPLVRPEEGKSTFCALSEATKKKFVRALHDCSEGGFAVAAAEMAFAGGFGMELSLKGMAIPQEEHVPLAAQLFSESHSRFVAEVDPYYFPRFEAVLDEWGVAYARLGTVSDKPDFRIVDAKGAPRIVATIADLRNAWIKPLAW